MPNSHLFLGEDLDSDCVASELAVALVDDAVGTLPNDVLIVNTVEILTLTIVYRLFQGLQTDLFVIFGVKAQHSLVYSIEIYRKIVHEADRLQSIFILIFNEIVLKIFEVTAQERVHEYKLFVIFRHSIAEQIGATQYQLLFHQ